MNYLGSMYPGTIKNIARVLYPVTTLSGHVLASLSTTVSRSVSPPSTSTNHYNGESIATRWSGYNKAVKKAAEPLQPLSLSIPTPRRC